MSQSTQSEDGGDDTKKILTIEDCKDILLKDLRHEDFSIKSYKISSLSDKIEGFLGEHFVVTIEYDSPTESKTQRYFMKLLSGASQVVIQMTAALKAFEKEEFFYNFLLEEFRKNGIDVSFAPQSYICKSNIVVLEDLSVKEYRSLSKNVFFDLKHCKQALSTLAKLHAGSAVYEKQKSYSLVHEHREMLKNIFIAKDPNSIVNIWFERSLEGILQIIEHVYCDDVQKNDIINKLKKFVDNSDAFFQDVDKYSCTVLHGDVWLNNFLFKYNHEQDPIDCVLIDYQIVNYGPPSLEVLHLLNCNTRRNFRSEHIDELTDFYYTTLQKNLTKYNVGNFLPNEEYLKLLDKYKLWIKLQCICDRCVTFIPDKYVHERVKSDDDLRKFLLEDRAEVILMCFKEEQSFRELLLEDLDELRELLLKTII